MMNYWDRFTATIEQFPPWVALVEWSKCHSLPGLARIPIFNIVVFILDEIKKEDIMVRANSMAFDFFLSLFPTIIVLFTIVAYTPLYSQFSEALHAYIMSVMPGSAGKVAFQTIEDVATIERKGLLSIGFLLALWFSSNGVLAMMDGFEKEYHGTFIKRGFWHKRLIALKLTFLLGCILLGSVVLIVLGNAILGMIFKLIKISWFTKLSIVFLQWFVILLLFYSGISTIYREGIALRRKIRFINPGAILATLLSVITSLGFSFYVDNFDSYHKVYGSIGTLIVLLIWLQLNCFILLTGFELNASIAVIRDRRK